MASFVLKLFTVLITKVVTFVDFIGSFLWNFNIRSGDDQAKYSNIETSQATICFFISIFVKKKSNNSNALIPVSSRIKYWNGHGSSCASDNQKEIFSLKKYLFIGT